MSKYNKFEIGRSTLIFTKGDFEVYEGPSNVGRYFLVAHGIRVAQKNVTETEPNFNKWIAQWTKNAEKQLGSIQDRMNNLMDERDEILHILTGMSL